MQSPAYVVSVRAVRGLMKTAKTKNTHQTLQANERKILPRL